MKIFNRNNDYSLKQKIINFSVITFIFISINIINEFRNNSIDPHLLRIKEFEDSFSQSFIGSFFQNTVSNTKKFREFNCKDLLL
jgi:hypothetical protein